MQEVQHRKYIKVVYDGHLHEQIGKNIHFDLVDFDNVKSLCIQRESSFSEIKDHLADKLGIPANHKRFWVWNRRTNCTYRPTKPLTKQDESRSIDDLILDTGGADLRLLLEEQKLPDDQLLDPPSLIPQEDILLFFKLYDPENEKLRYIGKQFVKLSRRPLDDLEKFRKMSGFKADEEVELYEEISYLPDVKCELIDVMATYKENKLVDGDILCIQRSVSITNDLRYPSVKMFFHHIKNCQVVHFRKLERPEEDVLCLELNKSSTYNEVVETLARYLKLDDPSEIRLTPQNVFTKRPGVQSIKYQGVRNLADMLAYYNQMSDTLYYEIFDMPLPNMEKLKVFNVSYYNSKVEKVSAHTIILPRESTVADIIRDLRGKVEISDQQAELRILQISDHRIWKMLSPSDKIDYMTTKYVTYRAEKIPEEERCKGPKDCIIHVYHFKLVSAKKSTIVDVFGEPFLFLARAGETASQLKERIMKKLEVPDDQFSEFQLAAIRNSPRSLCDDEVVVHYFQTEPTYYPWEIFLGLQHKDLTLSLPPQEKEVKRDPQRKLY